MEIQLRYVRGEMEFWVSFFDIKNKFLQNN